MMPTFIMMVAALLAACIEGLVAPTPPDYSTRNTKAVEEMSRMELVWEVMQKQLELDDLREKYEALAGSRISSDDSPVSSTTASAPADDDMELRGSYCSSAWPVAGAPMVAIMMILVLM